ncbi:beta-Ala-His dipeptidase [Desulfonatronum lacustre]|uniref:beta-Ala-His dipeptidase n=1 Tax=Desulfonatronum lacustre TaxID=66849 RepID=UPI0004B9AAD5|nr:beta-Ala-His dipeptidase [Desulfonatronum lacustre]
MKCMITMGLLWAALACFTLGFSTSALAAEVVPDQEGPALGGDGADTQRILAIFEAISQVPRCSKDEKRIAAWLIQWAEERGLPVKTDAFNNVIVFVPATEGYADAPVVALQAHMDMVCQKTADSDHDFTIDPIRLVRDGEWLRATDTTLGADDGIGMAIALFLAEEPGLKRPALELLFTTDEEVDMSGAEGLAEDALSAERFINIDSETEGFVTLGAAGGVKMEITLPLAFAPLPSGQLTYSLRINGLLGGHSGVEIHKNRANANVLIAHALGEAVPFRLISFAGGSADNAITPTSELIFALDPGHEDALKARIAAFEQEIRREYPEETGLVVTLQPVSAGADTALSEADTAQVIELVLAIPQGVVEWSETFSGLPETSNNIGILLTTDAALELTIFHRSFSPEKLENLAKAIERTAADAGAATSRRSQFPTWPPNPDSVLYKKALAAYERAFSTPLRTEVLHAGLECGFIAEKYPHMEIISIGPTLEYVHTPRERLNVPSVERVALFLRELLGDLGESGAW